MFLQRFCLIALLAILLAPITAIASGGDYNYISAADLADRLTTKQPTNIIDIQVKEEFAQHHITGATPTYAYPVKSDADRTKLDAIVSTLKSNADPVVIVCPRGGGGAKRTYDHLSRQGVSAERMQILKKGQQGWPSASFIESKQ